MSNLRSILLTAHSSLLTATPGHVPARCVKPPGRSLEPRSDARPRGMAVQSRLAGTDRIRLTGPAAIHYLLSISSKAKKPALTPIRRADAVPVALIRCALCVADL